MSLLRADARHLPLMDGCVDCCVTSPPYWGLRDYGNQSQIGLEPTPDAYVQNMVTVFREVRRVLKEDGTVWLNLGDTYCGYWGDSKAKAEGRASSADTNGWTNGFNMNARPKYDTLRATGIKPKDLVGIPWRVAFALQADGWYLRSDIIWSKPNPMPESVTDRPTKAHEYIFLLSKSARYHYDAAAIAEPIAESTREWGGGKSGWGPSNINHATPTGTHGPALRGEGRCGERGDNRNRRSVWTVPTMPYAGAHFATMPEKLVEPCILAGCPPAGKRCDCDEIISTPTGTGEVADPSIVTGRAGMNRPRRADEGTRPITRREQRDYAEQMRVSPFREQMATEAGEAFAHYMRTDSSGARPAPQGLLREWLGRGWLREPAPCTHPYEQTGLVLDPFIGSGTVGAVAERLGRRWVGTDLSYHDLAKKRTAQRGIVFEAIA